MKKSIYRIFAAALTLVAVGCTGNENPGPFMWEKVNPYTDSLTQSLDRRFYMRTDDSGIAHDIGLLEKELAKDTGNVELRGRVDYYRAFEKMRTEGTHAADTMLAAAMQRVDSTAHPYLYNRLAYIADNTEERNVASYDRIVARIEFFEKCGDRFMTAANLTDLGNMLKNIRESKAAVSAYEKADSLYILAGFDRIARFNRMNMASAHVVARDTATAVKILRDMSRDPIVEARPDVLERVLSNLFLYTVDKEVLDRLWSVEGDNHAAMTLYYKSQITLQYGDAAEALSLADRAAEVAIEEGDGEALAWALYAGAEAAAAAGDKTDAYDRFTNASELTDRITLANEPDAIADLETARIISNRKMEAELTRNRNLLRNVCIAFLLFAFAAGAVWVMTWRIQRLRFQRELTRRERDEMARRLIATQAAMDESETLITKVGKEIGSMADSGRLPDGETRHIVSAIKSHSAMKEDRESFMDSFAAIHPEFAQGLRNANEAFTEPDIRLATYIVMGMDTKRIASTMGIRPDSVKQGRWRLRQKLALPKGESLEKALRSYLDNH